MKSDTDRVLQVLELPFIDPQCTWKNMDIKQLTGGVAAYDELEVWLGTRVRTRQEMCERPLALPLAKSILRTQASTA